VLFSGKRNSPGSVFPHLLGDREEAVSSVEKADILFALSHITIEISIYVLIGHFTV
jgi:hypothetical protein